IGVLEEKSKNLNKKFITYHLKKRPFITLKWAETADGYMGRDSDNSASKQISAKRNNYIVHKLRANHQAILVGANTVNNDDPLLNVRFAEGNNPIKIVLSKSMTLNESARLLKSDRTIVYNAIKSGTDANVEYVKLPILSLDSILADLHMRKIQSVLIEGGAEVLGQFIDSALWDEALILKSETEWVSGIKAPFLGIKCVKNETCYGDTLKYFVR
ncbi:MAG: RibD family protein, partial [Bacteroidia bacterium]|nr:RibD family protein [Bacteroidia bacterium]